MAKGFAELRRRRIVDSYSLAAALMAMADGRSEVEEWGLATRLAGALGFDRARVGKCLDNARAKLRELAAEHDLAPEIRANLTKQGLAE